MSNSIRDMFHSSDKFNTAEIIIETINGPVSLYYHLSDNPVQHIWQDLYKDSSEFSMGVTHGNSLEYLVDTLNKLLKTANKGAVGLPVSQDQLNRLHNEFVNSTSNDDNALKVNLLIHAIESKNNILTEFDSTTVFYKKNNTVRIPIKEEYKLWLMNNFKWGQLLLGFGTLGKSWTEIVETNDNLDDLAMQTDISSETTMVFNAEYPCLKIAENRLYEWAANSEYDVPLDNLNQLSLGLYLLGEIIITDTFLNFHNTISDWYVPNHYCKLSWNKEVLGYNSVIKQIRFFNSDMYFESLIKHANLESLCLK